MSDFKQQLRDKFYQSIYNDYGIENYDIHRYGAYPEKFKKKAGSLEKFKQKVKKGISYKSVHTETYFEEKYKIFTAFEDRIHTMWKKLSAQDRKTVIEIFAYRMLGFKKVKLSNNNEVYASYLKKIEALKNEQDFIVSNYNNVKLHKYDLNSFGYDLSFYFTKAGIAIDFLLEQYAYKKDPNTIIEAEKGDVVLDLGGCWGDTALYFADKVGDKGSVCTFEFVPQNLTIFRENLAVNPNVASRVKIVEQPVSNKSDIDIYFKDNGPGSIVQMKPFKEQTGSVKTISIDDFVKKEGLDRVDYIKMDIEGSEPLALEGALETIKKFKPKLAIAIYHSVDDFVNIPNWILDLNLGYEIFIDHYTINVEETVCFAKIKS